MTQAYRCLSQDPAQVLNADLADDALADKSVAQRAQGPTVRRMTKLARVDAGVTYDSGAHISREHQRP